VDKGPVSKQGFCLQLQTHSPGNLANVLKVSRYVHNVQNYSTYLFTVSLCLLLKECYFDIQHGHSYPAFISSFEVPEDSSKVCEKARQTTCQVLEAIH
jgi:hypothetical protein